MIVSAQTIDQDWRRSIDPALLARLWGPVERPGMLAPGVGRAILARHLGMAGGQALAERLHGRAGPLPDTPLAQASIAYAQPHPWPADGDLPVATAASPAPARPVVVARQARPAQVPLPSAPAPTVVQRRAEPAPAPGARAALPPGALARAHKLAELPLPPRGAAPTTYPRMDSTVQPGTAMPGAPEVDALSMTTGIPRVEARESLRGDQRSMPGFPLVYLAWPPADQASRPVVRSIVRQAAPVAPRLPVIRAYSERQPVMGASLPLARPGQSLAAGANSATARHPATAERQIVPAGPEPTSARLSAAPAPAARGAEARRAEPAAVDIDEIVDQVHRKFMRRLAIEGERRGAR